MGKIQDVIKKLPEAALGVNGQADIGALQPSGTVLSAATHSLGTELTLVVGEGANFQAGQSILVAGTTDYNDIFEVLEVNTDNVVISATFTSSQSGTWNQKGAVGQFIGFMAMEADLPAGDIVQIAYQYSDKHFGDAKLVSYIAGLFYVFPGIITKIEVNAGNIRLVRFQ